MEQVYTIVTWRLSLVTTAWPSSFRTYFNLCCLVGSLWLMPCLCCTDNVWTVETHLHWEWALGCFGPILLVGFWCVDTTHMAQTLAPAGVRLAFWNLARGVPSASLLEDLTPDWDMGSKPDLASRPGLVQGRLFGMVWGYTYLRACNDIDHECCCRRRTWTILKDLTSLCYDHLDLH
jgi:hypothetical protein